MPTAVVKNKVETTSNESNEPMQKVLDLIEKKIRNLEKRKGKLEQYEKEATKGKELNEDQKAALARKTEVDQQLEFVRDMSKSVQTLLVDCKKTAKANAKKEQYERQRMEMDRIRNLMQLQTVLDMFGHDNTREHFRNGTQGALKLSEDQLETCDKLYEILCPSLESVPDADAWSKRLDDNAQIAHSILQGACNKPILNTTCKDIRTMLDSILACDFFNKMVSTESRSLSPDIQVKSDAASTVSSEDMNRRATQSVSPLAQPTCDPVVTFANGDQTTANQMSTAEGIRFLQDETNPASGSILPSAVAPAAGYGDPVTAATPGYTLSYASGPPLPNLVGYSQPPTAYMEVRDPPPPIPLPSQGASDTNRSSPDSGSRSLDPNAQPFVSHTESSTDQSKVVGDDHPQVDTGENDNVSTGTRPTASDGEHGYDRRGRGGGNQWRGRGGPRGGSFRGNSGFRSGPRGGYRGYNRGGGRGEFHGSAGVRGGGPRTRGGPSGTFRGNSQ